MPSFLEPGTEPVLDVTQDEHEGQLEERDSDRSRQPEEEGQRRRRGTARNRERDGRTDDQCPEQEGMVSYLASRRRVHSSHQGDKATAPNTICSRLSPARLEASDARIACGPGARPYAVRRAEIGVSLDQDRRVGRRLAGRRRGR